MKKRLCLISVLLIAAMIGSMTIAAAQAESDDLYAVATTESGKEIILADAPDAGEMGDLESYSLIVENEPVLTVEQSDIPDPASGADNNGYFSTEFDLPETTKRVFLAGLTAGNVEEIQSRIILAYASGADFELQDLSFIDAEKMKTSNDGDDYLCWAATASNILTYTGWAAQAGFETTDDVFEDFIASFTDNGGAAYYGIAWFFNGVNTYPTLVQSENVSSATQDTGGYLTDYAFDKLVTSHENVSGGTDGMRLMYQRLKDGYGVGLSISVYNTLYQADTGGHAVTCWGYIADTAYGDAEPEHYAGLFLTDSDSDQRSSGNRRNAKNILQAVSITDGINNNGDLTYEFELDSQNHATLREFMTLAPYSADLEKETAFDATRDKVNTPDLSVAGFYLGTDLMTGTKHEIMEEKIESHTAFFYTPLMVNYADAVFSGKASISIGFTDESGNTVFSRTLNPSSMTIDPGSGASYKKMLVNYAGLAAGDYTISVMLNENHTTSEAYYYNNTGSFTLKVRDSYLLGDTDSSGKVDILDVTKIQRILAEYNENADDKMYQRATITESKLNILDATTLQRFLAEYTVSYPVGEKQLYD